MSHHGHHGDAQVHEQVDDKQEMEKVHGGEHGNEEAESVDQPPAEARSSIDLSPSAPKHESESVSEESLSSHTLLPPMDIPNRFPTADEVRHVASLHSPSSPTTALLAAFRTQIANLSDQSTDLNTKLIQALTDRADLEDAHLALQSEHSVLQERAGKLQKEKDKWEESMKTGLLVEREVISVEMQKLAAGLVEEERKRGSAEVRRQQVENELDDLAATLFDQANTMVATERMAKAQAEERLKRTEDNLAAAESAMRDMQLHLQSMTDPSITSPKLNQKTINTRYLSSHLPYTEFLSFIDALHNLRPLKNARKSAFPPPSISSYLAHPFINRIIVEDHEPTIRLDSAPTLSYFSRRNVGPAIIAGELIIEPVPASTILNSTTTPAHDIGCALCGKPVFPTNVLQSPATSQFGAQVAHPTAKQSRFSLKPFFNTSASGSPVTGTNPSPGASPLASPSVGAYTPGSTNLPSVYVFRVAASAGSEKEAKPYPLCKTGWCLERLRAACELWHFVRTGIIHVVWNADDGWLHPLERQRSTPRQVEIGSDTPGSATPHGERTVSGSSVVSQTSTSATSVADASTATGVDSVIATDKAERKKSGGWGLGFKFGRSGSNTPPISPDTESQQAKISEKIGLDPPVEIVHAASPVDDEKAPESEGAKVEEAEGVPRIEEQAASPVSGGEEGAPISSAASSTSVASSGGGDFSTPKGQSSELPEDGHDQHHEEAKEDKSEEDEEKEKEQKGEGEGEAGEENAGETVDLNSPHVPDTPSAPPVPRRASGRGVVPPKTPIEAEGETPETVPEVQGQVERAESVEGSHEEGLAASNPPPPLPARHPRTPVLSSARERLARAGVDGEKRWLDTEGGWEERTWRQVVLLKQGMFKARVGVSDAEE